MSRFVSYHLLMMVLFVAPLHGQSTVASSQYSTITICNPVGVVCSGINSAAGLGDSTAPLWQGAIVSHFDLPVTFVSVANSGTIAIDSSGAVFFWGIGGGFVLGDSNQLGPIWNPRRIEYLEPSKAAYVDDGYVASLRTDGKVVVCGTNLGGAYGNGTKETIYAAAAEVTIDSVAKLIVGGPNVLAIRRDSSLWLWGQCSKNSIYSQVLERDSTDDPFLCLVPTRVMPERKFLDVSVGQLKGSGNFLSAVTQEGTLIQLGFNKFKHIDSDSLYVLIPVEVSFPSRCVQVLCSFENVIVLCEDGSVWMSGGNSKNQKPFSTTRRGVFSKVPIPVAASAIYGSGYSHFVRASDGSLYGWGDNSYSQISVNLPPTSGIVPQIVASPCTLVSVNEEQEAGQYLTPDRETSFHVVDLQGRVFLQGSSIYTDLMQMDQYELPRGIYVLVTVTARGVKARKFVQY